MRGCNTHDSVLTRITLAKTSSRLYLLARYLATVLLSISPLLQSVCRKIQQTRVGYIVLVRTLRRSVSKRATHSHRSQCMYEDGIEIN